MGINIIITIKLEKVKLSEYTIAYHHPMTLHILSERGD
jgi:hypothetical protein